MLVFSRLLTLLSLFVKMNAQLTNKAVSLFSSSSQDTAFFAPLGTAKS
jgi:hypothetical protein